MAITIRGTVVNPADNVTLLNAGGAIAIDPTSLSNVTGDLIVLTVAARSSAADIAISNTGGQTWTALDIVTAAGSINYRVFWCRFNGTWSANPSITTTAGSDRVVSLHLTAAIPTSGGNTWAVDVAQTDSGFTAPAAPGDVTNAGKTAVAASTITYFWWVSNAKDTYAMQGGISNAGSAYYRSNDSAPSGKRDQTLSVAYVIRTSSGATGAVTNRQTTSTTHNGRISAVTFKESASGVTISAVDSGSNPIVTGSSVVFTGTKSGASWSSVKVSPTNNAADGSAVSQSITASDATHFTIGSINLSSFSDFTNLYVFATDSSGNTNSSGFVIQRGSQLTLSGVTLEDLSGSPQASLSAVEYAVRTLDGATTLLEDDDATTNGSGVLSTLGPHTLTSGGPVARGDHILLELRKDPLYTLVELTPTYS